jgi:hypothetical protein
MHGMRQIFQNCYSLEGRLQNNHTNNHRLIYSHRSYNRRSSAPSNSGRRSMRAPTRERQRSVLDRASLLLEECVQPLPFDEPWRESPQTERDRKAPSSSRLRSRRREIGRGHTIASVNAAHHLCCPRRISDAFMRCARGIRTNAASKLRLHLFESKNCARERFERDPRNHLLRNTSCCFANYVQCC